MQALLHNMSTRLNNDHYSNDVSAVERERATGVLMSNKIDDFIREAKNQPLGPYGMHSMYWRGGRVLSEARDVYKASNLGEHDPQRIFSFEDCGEKPKNISFHVDMLCAGVGKKPQHCCATKMCRAKEMSAAT